MLCPIKEKIIEGRIVRGCKGILEHPHKREKWLKRANNGTRESQTRKRSIRVNWKFENEILGITVH